MSFLFILLPFWLLVDLWMTNRHFSFWGAMTLIIIALMIGGMLFKAHEMLHAVRHREYKIS